MPAQAPVPVSRPKSIAVRGPRGEAAKPMNVIADVRGHIAFWDQTNPAKFPPYEFVEFPKMMLTPDGAPYVDEGTGEPIVVYGEDEEAEFKAQHETMTVVNNLRLNREEREELERLRAANPGALIAATEDVEAVDAVTAPTAPNRLAATMTTKPRAKPSPRGGGGQRLRNRGGESLPKPLKGG